jgi:hypothetical protein
MGSSGGGGGGSAAGGNSLASIGLQAYSTMLSAQGTATADEYQAAKLENAAKYGELKAVQTGGQMTRSLNTTLGNIEAVRAAAHSDPTSPTGAAILDEQERLGTDQKLTTVNSILAQASQEKSDAAYYRSAAKDALFAGEISTAAGIAKGIAGLGMPGG